MIGLAREGPPTLSSRAMANGVVRTAAVIGAMLGLPVLCGVGVLAYGRALADAEVAEGTLRSPEETRAAFAELDRRFRALSPAEHLAAARRELDCGYDPATRSGGNFRGARRHLDAIPAGAESVGVAELRAAIAARDAAWSDAVVSRLGELTAAAAAEAAGGVAPSRAGEIRRGLARGLDRFAAARLGCVHTEGEGDSVLRIDGSDCDPATLARHLPAAQQDALRRLGFTRVRCRNGAAALSLAGLEGR